MNDQIVLKKLADGVDGCYIPSHRFKTARISVTAYLPLEKQSVAALSMLTLLISNGCARHPSPMELSRRLDTLYGASIGAGVDKLGDMLTLRAGIIFVEDKFLPDPIFSDCSQLLFDLIFDPAVDEGGFLESNFNREKRIQIEEIEGEINDKRTFARNRCVEAMCEGEPFGLPVNGTKEQALALTRGELYSVWKEMLATAHFRIAVTADKPHDEVYDAFLRALEKTARRNIYRPTAPIAHAPSEQVQNISDSMPVAQGKLVMGFACPSGEDAVSYPTMVMVDILGGGPYSLLFSNVREKMSLCYYCAARAVRKKGILLIDSGVEFDNMDKTYEAVLDQIEHLKAGRFDDSIIEASKLSICGSLKGAYDSQAVTDRWYADRLFDDTLLSPEELSERVNSVTREQIIEAAMGLKLDTVYKLLGK